MNTKSIKIEQTFLKHLREKSKLSQTTLALKAFADGTNNTKPESLIRSYQHIERTGKTSLKRATQIAKALGVNVQELQSPNIQDMRTKYKELIKSRFEEMRKAGDEESLKRAVEALNFHWRSFDSEQDYDWAVQEVLEIVERCFLSTVPEKLQPLADFLGITVEELKPVAPVESYWWFSGGKYDKLSIGKLVYYRHGQGIIDEIKKNWEEASIPTPRNFPSKVTVTKKGKKYRLSFQLLDYYLDDDSTVDDCFNWSCEFCACDIYSENGIQWLDSSEWEHEGLMEDIKNFLFNHGDKVVIENEQFPPEGQQIVWHVHFFEANYNQFDLLCQRKKIGTRIFRNSWEFSVSLGALLRKYEDENWDFEPRLESRHVWEIDDVGVQIKLSELNRKSNWEEKREIKCYQISLGWLDNGIFHKAPWSEIKRKQFIEQHKKLGVSEYGILVPDDDYVITPFEPDASLAIIDAEEL